MQLLISDTNIIIDLDVCGLIEKMFDLSYAFAVPDVLYIEELEEQHGELPAYGLLIKSLESEKVDYAVALQAKHIETSPNDLFALALAKQEECPLLTGDMALRTVAAEEEIEIKGTLWIVEQMVVQGIIGIDRAEGAFEDMKMKQRRLPWKEVERMLERLRDKLE
ncbi:PIN domain-containing protein [Sulfurimonas sp. HSL1-2]|uniref:PIN domain-containing protein n=1 Tax=Thiomicrolovo zhangzhouensis TaxID=3131933 RepID=UPI0031F82579